MVFFFRASRRLFAWQKAILPRALASDLARVADPVSLLFI
jgi:hypothetical protein